MNQLLHQYFGQKNCCNQMLNLKCREKKILFLKEGDSLSVEGALDNPTNVTITTSQSTKGG